MVLKMPVVLAKHEKLLDSFRTGLGLSFDDTGIDHCEMHRHAVSRTRHDRFDQKTLRKLACQIVNYATGLQELCHVARQDLAPQRAVSSHVCVMSHHMCVITCVSSHVCHHM
jgi:hypothetical protein